MSGSKKWFNYVLPRLFAAVSGAQQGEAGAAHSVPAAAGSVPVVEEETEEEAHVSKQRQEKKEAEAAKKALKDKHEKFNAFVSARQKQEPEEQRRFTVEMKRQMKALPPGSLSNPKDLLAVESQGPARVLPRL